MRNESIGDNPRGRREVQTELAEWELVEPGCWVRKLREWDSKEVR